MNIGLLAAIGAVICWSFGDFFIQRTVRKIGSIESLFFIGLIGSFLLFPFVAAELPSAFSNSNILLSLFFLGFITLLVSLTNMFAYREGKLSIIDPLLELELPVAIILGIVFLKESISAEQLLLSFAILAGIILISIKNFSSLSYKLLLEKGALLGIATALGMGFMDFAATIVARTASPLLAIWSAWLMFGVACGVFIFYKKRFRGIILDARKNIKLILAEGIFDTSAWSFYAIALVSLPLSITTAMTEIYPAFAVLLGVHFNKEKINMHQKFGIGLALVSAVWLGFTVV